jgi:hypothetical protein
MKVIPEVCRVYYVLIKTSKEITRPVLFVLYSLVTSNRHGNV